MTLRTTALPVLPVGLFRGVLLLAAPPTGCGLKHGDDMADYDMARINDLLSKAQAALFADDSPAEEAIVYLDEALACLNDVVTGDAEGE